MLDHDIEPRWRKIFLEEWVTPYRPRDNRGLNEEYLTVRPRRAEGDQKPRIQDIIMVSFKLGNELSNGHG